jgi:hypothetical protein
MMRYIAVSTFVLGAWVALAAQAPANAPGAYDSAAEATYGGVITAVLATNGPDGAVGVHLEVATARGARVMVHLGPAMFIGMNDASFFADDQILVTGAFVSHDGAVALWARQITKNGKTLVLRNSDGTPRWLYATTDDPDGCGIAHGVVRD